MHHADGKVEFNITAFDLAGNSLTVNQTHFSKHHYKTNSSLARAGDLINITLEASEQIKCNLANSPTINMTESNNTAYANISVLQRSTLQHTISLATNLT